LKSYGALSFQGKLRRLRDLAVAALTNYDLESPEIVYHGFSTNLLYRVTTASGERFMLLLASPSWRTFEDLRSEAMWLVALGRETTIAAPRIIRHELVNMCFLSLGKVSPGLGTPAS
jgi:hypothetical protein